MDEAQHNHDDKVRLLRAKMPPDERLSDLAGLRTGLRVESKEMNGSGKNFYAV